jgi:Pre ATP-grasp domain
MTTSAQRNRRDRHKLRPAPSIPVVEHLPVEIDAAERQRIAGLAGKLLADEPVLSSTEPFGSNLSPGLGPWPSLALEDHSGIALYDPEEESAYAYRALLLAGEGDQVVIGVRRSPAFERYCSEVLRLGSVDVVSARAARRRRGLAARCLRDAELLERVAQHARAAGGLNLLPYMATGGLWALAGAIAARSGVEVRVGAPPPRLAHRVNDKLWFAERVAEVLGRRALPPAHPAFSLWALTRRVLALARHHASVAVKLPDSASARGNFVLESERLLRLPSLRVLERLRRALHGAGWRGRFPLLVTGWEQPVAANPSVQLWIPDGAAGPPVVEGIFEQRLAGEAGLFAGAAPSDLPLGWQRRLAAEASRLACLFQDLGYFGRCSCDAILVGEDPASWQLHWIECNGRWGGTSIPMTLANRLVGNWRRRPFVVVDKRTEEPGREREFAAFLQEIDGDLFAPAYGIPAR